MPEAVRTVKVCKIFEGAVRSQVLFDIDLSFEQGTFNSIIGPSGSGKSTLMNIIGTLDRPTSGEVYLSGTRTESLDNKGLSKLRNKEIGFIFQFHYLLPEFTAIENVIMPQRILQRKVDDKARKRADELIEMVGLSKVKNNLSTKMSGGQQQRTAIARALMNSPKVILADEPTGNLDSENSDQVYRLFREINERLGTTFIVVTHDRRIAERTDRIVEMKDGRVLLDVHR